MKPKPVDHADEFAGQDQTRRPRHWGLMASLTIAVVVAGSFLALTTFRTQARRSAPNAPVLKRANAAEPRTLGHFRRVPGTSILRAEISSGHDEYSSSSGGMSLSSLSSRYATRVIHNHVYLDVDELSVRRLIPTNDYAIIVETALLDDTESTDESKKTSVSASSSKWLLYEVVTQDTNHDGLLDFQDLRTLAMSDRLGRGYTELIGGISELYRRALRNDNTLVAIYESHGTKQASVIDLERRAVTETRPLAGLGSDVK